MIWLLERIEMAARRVGTWFERGADLCQRIVTWALDEQHRRGGGGRG